MNDTTNTFAVTVPVAKVPADLKLVPNVKTKLVVPEVVTMKCIRAPARPPEALKVQAAVGVIVTTEPLVMVTVIAPVVAGAALAAMPWRDTFAAGVPVGNNNDSQHASRITVIFRIMLQQWLLQFQNFPGSKALQRQRKADQCQRETLTALFR